MPRFNPSILQKAKNMKNRALLGLGSLSILGGVYPLKSHKKISVLALCLSLFLVGSCNESAGVFDFSKKPDQLSALTRSELVRYGYALQVALLQAPENVKKLGAREVQLALSKPDYERQDGRNNIWQYRGDSCVLDVYWQSKAGEQPVSHFEVRQRRSVLDGTQAVVDPVQWQCVQAIIQKNRRNMDRGFSDIYADLSLKAHKS